MAPRTAYFNAAGKRLRSVTTILGYKRTDPFVMGVLKRVREALEDDGTTLEDRVQRVRNLNKDNVWGDAAPVGTLAHAMVENDLLGKEDGIDFSRYLQTTIDQARVSFGAYLNWKQMSHLEIHYTEIALISEEHQFGGRLDHVGVVPPLGNGLCILDVKTSKAIYGDYLAQIGGYSIAWDETYDTPITGGGHLLRFDKETGGFTHHQIPQASLEIGKKGFLAALAFDRAMQEMEKHV